MYRSYPEKSKIYVNQNVVHVEHLGHDGVVVYTQDGQSYKGDLVVGADGVHSHMRTRMWQFADMVRPGMIPDYEKKGTYSFCNTISVNDEEVKG
jgi:2-polyprenyl-6-methoxyphenol hydroxylase-like FAD-dependent oxidoreductase